MGYVSGMFDGLLESLFLSLASDVEFQGISSRKEKKESALGHINSLLDEIPRLRTYGDMFPTDEMKDFLAQFYIHTVDLLWRLAKYYSLGFFSMVPFDPSGKAN